MNEDTIIKNSFCEYVELSNEFKGKEVLYDTKVAHSVVLEEEFNIHANIKWPNDLLVEKAKISGILAEAYTEHNKIKGIVYNSHIEGKFQKES